MLWTKNIRAMIWLRSIFVQAAIVTGSEDNKNVITLAINAMFWWDTHLDLLLDFFFTLIEILHNQT